SKIAHELIADLDKETVDFVANYDETEHEPSVFPTRVPNLLVNGSAGIAVGMATNIPPHNLTEVINACLAMIENPEIDIPGLMEYIPGPDFPTAGIINGVRGIHEAYRTGRGRIHIRARSHVEENDKGRQKLVFTELPYQVNKARLLEKIAELVKDKKIEGISGLRDESDKDGMRMVVDLKRGEVAEVVLNNLYQHTQLQNVFGINMVALVDGRPQLLNLKQCLEAFIRHRRDVVTRRTVFELRKARHRAHILEGLSVALSNIDEVIKLIKSSPNRAVAKQALMDRSWEPGAVTGMLERSGADASRPDDLAAGFGMVEDGYRLSETQTQAILDLRLHQLTGLEQDKIVNEYKELLDLIDELLAILQNPDRLMEVIREELQELLDQYGDERRTEILTDHLDLTLEDLITEEDVVVTLSHAGYAKSQPLSDYRAQRRGGRGKSAANVREEDFIDKLFIASTHDTILCFSSRGKVYWLKVYELPQAGRTARGKPIVNLLPLQADERINAILPVREFSEDQYVFMATSKGTVKKTALSGFSRPRANGIIGLDLRDGDYLIDVAITDGSRDIMLFSDAGKVIRFKEDDVRAMGRTACGVRGIKLPAGQRVISLIIASDSPVLTATENGYGKRTAAEDYPVYGRGGQGVIAIQVTERNGVVVGAVAADDNDEVMLISGGGTLVRTRVNEISVMGRNTQGVRLIALGNGEKLVGIERVVEVKDDDDAAENVADSE
ncbi:MAG: DNA gyrase subunit A, partial [Gammaproteobacteria bacterium]